MAGRADFLVNLEAALELRLVKLAKRAIAGEFDVLGVKVERVFCCFGSRFLNRGDGAVSERPEQRDGEEQAYQGTKKTDHGVLFLLRFVAVRQL